MKSEILVSIIMPVFNSVKTIERAINSVKYQTYKNIELVIIDGGSTDGTISVIEEYSDLVGFFLSEKDRGYSDALNKGIKKAKGEYSIILAADDFLLPDAIERFVNSVEDSTDVWCGNMYVLKKTGVVTRFKRAESLEELKGGKYLAHPATFFRVKSFEKYGFYNIQYKINADAELLLRFCNSGARFQIEDEFVSVFVCGGMSVKEDLGESAKDLFTESDVEKVSILHGASVSSVRFLRIRRFIKKKIANIAKKIPGERLLKIMYTLDGQKPLSEKEIKELGAPLSFYKTPYMRDNNE